MGCTGDAGEVEEMLICLGVLLFEESSGLVLCFAFEKIPLMDGHGILVFVFLFGGEWKENCRVLVSVVCSV